MDYARLNEPLTAYQLFYCDEFAVIKKQYGTISAQDASKIINERWDGIDPSVKEVYNKTAELIKNEIGEQMDQPTEDGSIYSDRGDEYCSNESFLISFCDEFNAWVQANLRTIQQQQELAKDII